MTLKPRPEDASSKDLSNDVACYPLWFTHSSARSILSFPSTLMIFPPPRGGGLEVSTKFQRFTWNSHVRLRISWGFRICPPFWATMPPSTTKWRKPTYQPSTKHLTHKLTSNCPTAQTIQPFYMKFTLLTQLSTRIPNLVLVFTYDIPFTRYKRSKSNPKPKV